MLWQDTELENSNRFESPSVANIIQDSNYLQLPDLSSIEKATPLTASLMSDYQDLLYNNIPSSFPTQPYNKNNFNDTAPTATLTASNLTKAPNGNDSYSFAVTYNDDVLVDPSSLDSADLLVTGPNGFNQLATLVSIYPDADDSNLTAFYKFAPPGNSWDVNDAGTYTVNLQSNQVRDISGNAILAGSLGTFQINVKPFSQNILFPSDARIINVKTEFGAKGDGLTDDTQAIQNAFQSSQGTNQTVYFPVGTYLVSSPVWFRSWMTVQGENSERTIIKLKDNAPGYQDTNNPSWLMATTYPASPIGRSGDNMAFSNFVMDLTLDTGRGNPGAIAMQFISNNGGGLENVNIRSGDRSGPIGLDLRTPWNGPSMFKNVQIDGFDYGIVSWHATYFSTFESISLTNQRVAGWENADHPLVVRKLISNQNGVPAIINSGDSGHFLILDSQLRNNGGNVFAIQNDRGDLFVRNVSTAGYQSAIENYGVVIPGTNVNEYVSGQVYTQFPSPPATLNLPIKDTPALVWEPLENWVSVEDFADKVTNGDWAPAIQAAIDSGKSTVYFPQGSYPIRSTVIVRGNVKVIQGLGSELKADGYSYNGSPMFRIETGASPELWIDRLAFGAQEETPATLAVEHASAQTLVALNSRYMSYRNTPGVGDLFVENMPASPWYFQYPQQVWIRGLNVETGDKTKVINQAADLWVMGWKSEGRATELNNGPQARTEILGGNFYPASGDPEQYPTFINRGGRLSAVHAMFWANHTYIIDNWQGQQKILRLEPGTRFMPLYVTNPSF